LVSRASNRIQSTRRLASALWGRSFPSAIGILPRQLSIVTPLCTHEHRPPGIPAPWQSAALLGFRRRDRRFNPATPSRFPPANLFSRRLPNLMVVSDPGSTMGATNERAGAPRRGDRSRCLLPDQPGHRLSVTPYRAHYVGRHRRTENAVLRASSGPYRRDCSSTDRRDCAPSPGSSSITSRE
jgi:hypothetical protein